MSVTPEDVEREEFLDRITEEILENHRETIVAEFVEDRLASYFEDHPNLSQQSQTALDEAKALLELSSAAALIFAMSSVEIAIRDVLLKPVVAGLVHNPFFSDVMADLVDIRNRKTLTVLEFVMQEIGLPKLSEQKLASGQRVWIEKNELQQLRNEVVHRGGAVTPRQAERALILAEYFLNDLYPKVRDHLTHRSTGWV